MPFFSRMILASVTFWMPGPEATRLPARSAMVFTGLSIGTTISSSTKSWFDGLEQMMRNRSGDVISPRPSAADAVPLAEPSMRPAIIASTTWVAEENLAASTSSPASLNRPFSMAT